MLLLDAVAVARLTSLLQTAGEFRVDVCMCVPPGVCMCVYSLGSPGLKDIYCHLHPSPHSKRCMTSNLRHVCAPVLILQIKCYGISSCHVNVSRYVYERNKLHLYSITSLRFAWSDYFWWGNEGKKKAAEHSIPSSSFYWSDSLV